MDNFAMLLLKYISWEEGKYKKMHAAIELDVELKYKGKIQSPI